VSSYTVREIAERWGISVHTVLAWIRANELKAVNVSRTPNGRKPRWRITQAALDAFEAARTSHLPAPRAKRRKSSDDVVSFY
jgi:excisionase family DNA binding protein